MLYGASPHPFAVWCYIPPFALYLVRLLVLRVRAMQATTVCCRYSAKLSPLLSSSASVMKSYNTCAETCSSHTHIHTHTYIYIHIEIRHTYTLRLSILKGALHQARCVLCMLRYVHDRLCPHLGKRHAVCELRVYTAVSCQWLPPSPLLHAVSVEMNCDGSLWHHTCLKRTELRRKRIEWVTD